MNNRNLFVFVLSALAVLLTWFFVDVTVASILIIITLTLIFSMLISADAAKHLHPEVFASIDDDAQTIIIENLGTAPASDVRVRIIPDDIRFEVGTLAPDANYRYELPSMIRNVKAAVSWKKKDGNRKEKIFSLSGYTEDTDPLKPIFPLFEWKDK